MTKFSIGIFSTLLGTLLVTGCASHRYDNIPIYSPYPVTPQPNLAYSAAYGIVESIGTTSPAAYGNSTGTGAVIGGIVGGMLGTQVGGGRGKTATTVAGIVGGAMIGNEIEQRSAQATGGTYQVGVRLDNGSYQSLTQADISGLQIGTRVRIENNRAYHY